MYACSCVCICVDVSLTYNTQSCLPETETFCICYYCPGKKIRDKVTYTGLKRELTGAPAVFKGEKAQSCGSGTELHMAGSGCWDQSCQSKSLAGDTLAVEGIPRYTRVLTERFSAALIIIRRRGEGVPDSFQTVGYEVWQ